MGIYTLDADFSSLNTKKANNWILRLRDMTEEAFADQGNQARLLGNLLIIEQYTHTLRQGLSAKDEQPSTILVEILDLLWGYLEKSVSVKDFEDFSNNVYASTLFHNADEELTDEQEDFYQKHFGSTELSSVEWQIITWASGLLIELVAIEGGRVEFEEMEGCEQISFADIDDLVGFLTDASIALAEIPRSADTGADDSDAVGQVYKTDLFQKIIKHIQDSLKTALAAVPEQYAALREEYRQYTLIPKEYCAGLVDFPQM